MASWHRAAVRYPCRTGPSFQKKNAEARAQTRTNTVSKPFIQGKTRPSRAASSPPASRGTTSQNNSHSHFPRMGACSARVSCRARSASRRQRKKKSPWLLWRSGVFPRFTAWAARMMAGTSSRPAQGGQPLTWPQVSQRWCPFSRQQAAISQGPEKRRPIPSSQPAQRSRSFQVQDSQSFPQ